MTSGSRKASSRVTTGGSRCLRRPSRSLALPRAAWLTIAATLAVLASAAPASACPFCTTDTGRLVWAGIFDERFLENLLVTAAPFAAFFALAAGIHFAPTRRHRGEREG